MKFQKEKIYKAGSASVNFHTGSQTIRGSKVGIKLRIKGKCSGCGKNRSKTEDYSGYINNGFNTLTRDEMIDKYTAEVDDIVKKLESGERTIYCKHCGDNIV